MALGAHRQFGSLEKLLIVMSVGFVPYGIVWAVAGGRFGRSDALPRRLVAEDRVVPGLLGLAGQLEHDVLDLRVLLE